LGKGIELPCVVEYYIVPFLVIQELLEPAVEQTH
jgi:hypothetical protein